MSLFCGDCLEILPTLPRSVNLVLADPPYGMTACKWDSVIPLEPLWKCLSAITLESTPIVMTAGQPFTSHLIMSNPAMFKHSWVWIKNRATAYLAAKYRPLQKHEDIVVFGKDTITYNPQKTHGHPPTNSAKSCRQAKIYQGSATWVYAGGETSRFPTTVQYFDVERGLHPTQKPVSLMEYLIKTYSNAGDTVLDFCMGSGTTGVACKNLGRKFIGIESNKEYFKIAQERIA